MDSQQASGLPAVFDLAETEIQEMSGEIKSLAKELKGIKKRIKDMAIFADRTSGGKLRKRSDVEMESSPEEELLYEHRRLYEETSTEFRKLLGELDQMRPGPDDVRQYHHMMQILRGMNNETKEHLQDMRKIQMDLRARESAIEGRIINIVQERARLVARMLEHNDKMEIARKATEIPTSAELQDRLAARYGVPVDQVQNLITAKQADAEIQP